MSTSQHTLQFSLSALFATLSFVAVALAATVRAAEGPAWPIRVEDGRFVDADGRPFAPRGFNYIRLFPGRSHDTFDPEHYDRAAIERTFRKWQQDGLNVVRVFVNTSVRQPGSLVAGRTEGLNSDYLANLADFLGLAREYDLGVVLTPGRFPRLAPYTDALGPPAAEIGPANADYLDARYVEAKARFLQDLIHGLRTARPGCLDAVFSYDLQNELCYHGSAPLTLSSGTVTGTDGRVYRLPNERQALADDGAIFYIDRLCDAIHAVHPGTLVGASVFTYAAVGRASPDDFSVKKAAWQNRIPFRPRAILRSKADYLDIHFYSTDAADFAEDLASIEFSAVRRLASARGKPLLVGEFGVFKRPFPEIGPATAWMGALAKEFSARGFAGWLYWTYDTHEQSDQLWHAQDADGRIYEELRRGKGDE